MSGALRVLKGLWIVALRTRSNGSSGRLHDVPAGDNVQCGHPFFRVMTRFREEPPPTVIGVACTVSVRLYFVYRTSYMPRSGTKAPCEVPGTVRR